MFGAPRDHASIMHAGNEVMLQGRLLTVVLPYRAYSLFYLIADTSFRVTHCQAFSTSGNDDGFIVNTREEVERIRGQDSKNIKNAEKPGSLQQ